MKLTECLQAALNKMKEKEEAEARQQAEEAEIMRHRWAAGATLVQQAFMKVLAKEGITELDRGSIIVRRFNTYSAALTAPLEYMIGWEDKASIARPNHGYFADIWTERFFVVSPNYFDAGPEPYVYIAGKDKNIFLIDDPVNMKYVIACSGSTAYASFVQALCDWDAKCKEWQISQKE